MTPAVLPRCVLSAALLVFAVQSPAALADRVFTDQSGQRLLLRDDGSYTVLPPEQNAPGNFQNAPGPERNGQGGAVQGGAQSGTSLGGRPAPPPSSGSAAPAQNAAPAPDTAYAAVALDEVAQAPVGELVTIQGWIGNVGSEQQFLMFRDRTVSPPYILVQISAPDPRVTAEWARELNGRCAEACQARVRGEIVAIPSEGAPTVLAHQVDVGR